MVEVILRYPQGADFTEGQKRIVKYFYEVLPKLVQAGAKKKGGWITAKEIARATGYSDKGTCRELRDDIHLLNLGHKKPIISGSQGFKVAENPDQLRRYASNLLERAKAEEYRAKILLEMAEKMQ